MYILPPEIESGAFSGEDDADEDDVGKPEDICVGQLKSSCELVMNSGKRITSFNDNDNGDEMAFDDALLIDVLENSSKI